MENSNESNEQDLKGLAENLLVKSVDEVSDDKEIIERIKDKIIFIKESKEIKVIYKTEKMQDMVGLYLIARFVGYKILNIFDKPSASSSEIASSFNLNSQTLARPLGILSREFIEKINDEYKIRAYKILEFINELDKEKTSSKNKKGNIKSVNETSDIKLVFREEGFRELYSFFEVTEEDLRKLFLLEKTT